ncbi:hypothetical protein SLS55_000394 [Diplodia seriata]|uniref:YDG domain-containing protein n=1 Tax=Diplodia seriata TaxID=420778 RepID=A0ABR3CU61_9PEZI
MTQKKWQQVGSRNNVGTNRNVDARLEQVKNIIKKCKEGRGVELEALFDQIRNELHDLVFLQVSDVAVRRKRMLHNDSGLPQLFDGGSHYQDQDGGEEIWYSGTDGKDGKASENTQSLMLNVTSGKEVRVIRSHNLSAASSYRPPRGFRYDGCYEVLSYRVLDNTKMACLFHLRRKSGQDPIRFGGKERRPTEAEVREYDKFKADIEASERI